MKVRILPQRNAQNSTNEGIITSSDAVHEFHRVTLRFFAMRFPAPESVLERQFSVISGVRRIIVILRFTGGANVRHEIAE